MTTPIPILDAFVSMINFTEKLGMANTSVVVMAVLSHWKARVVVSVKEKISCLGRLENEAVMA